jgi:hypothetical protein
VPVLPLNLRGSSCRPNAKNVRNLSGGKRRNIAPERRLRDCILTDRDDHVAMGIAAKRPSVPDLFSASSARELTPSAVRVPALPQRNHAPATSLTARHVLPSDLKTAIKQLDDEELDRLFSAVFAERKRRGKRLSNSDDRTQRKEAPTHSLTSGRVKAVRAAFTAGVTPSRIARSSASLGRM